MARSYVARRLVKPSAGSPYGARAWSPTTAIRSLDVHGLTLDRPGGIRAQVNQIAGVVTVGLFAHRGADVILVAGDNAVRTLNPRA
jgi:ribose 5-phosphate isomerase A